MRGYEEITQILVVASVYVIGAVDVVVADEEPLLLCSGCCCCCCCVMAPIKQKVQSAHQTSSGALVLNLNRRTGAQVNVCARLNMAAFCSSPSATKLLLLYMNYAGN